MNAQLTFEVVLPPEAQGFVNHGPWTQEEWDLGVFWIWDALCRASYLARNFRFHTTRHETPAWSEKKRVQAWVALSGLWSGKA